MSIYTALSAVLDHGQSSLPSISHLFKTSRAMDKIARGAVDLPTTDPWWSARSRRKLSWNSIRLSGYQAHFFSSLLLKKY